MVVNGSPSEKSKTVGLVDVMLQTLTTALAGRDVVIESSRIDVYRLGPRFSGAIEREGLAPEIEDLLRRAERADDSRVPRLLHRAVQTLLRPRRPVRSRDKPVFLAATGGGDHHALVLEHALRPLFGIFQAMSIPVAIFAASGDFDGHHPAQPARLRAHRDRSQRRGRHPQRSRRRHSAGTTDTAGVGDEVVFGAQPAAVYRTPAGLGRP